mgnify:CR=1 FL=1
MAGAERSGVTPKKRQKGGQESKTLPFPLVDCKLSVHVEIRLINREVDCAPQNAPYVV